MEVPCNTAISQVVLTVEPGRVWLMGYEAGNSLALLRVLLQKPGMPLGLGGGMGPVASSCKQRLRAIAGSQDFPC